MRPPTMTTDRTTAPLAGASAYGAQRTRFLEDRVATASPAELVGMLYDGLLTRIARARSAAGAGEWPEATSAAISAQRILIELRSHLDRERGGAIAANLDAIYEFAHRRLVAAVSERSLEGFDDAHRVLDPIRAAWAEGVLGRPPTTAGR